MDRLLAAVSSFGLRYRAEPADVRIAGRLSPPDLRLAEPA
jgi:hypothetical protein